MAESSPQAHQQTLEEEQEQEQANACFQTHPSTLEEARAFTNSLPGGIADLTKPSLPKPSLTWPSVTPPAQPQQPGSSVARPMVAGPVVTSAGPARSTLTSFTTPVTADAGSPATFSITTTTATATGSTVDTTKSAIVKSDGAPAAAGTSIGGVGNGVPGPIGGVVPTVSNILISVNLDCRLDLKLIALHCRNSEYNPRRFSAVVMRIRDPKSTALIFASGKMVVTGCKAEADARLAARKFARVLSKLGYAVKFTDFKVHNVVGTCDVGFPLALQRMASRYTHFSSYDPGMVSSNLLHEVRRHHGIDAG